MMNRRRHKMFKTSSGTTSVTSHCTVLNILWRHLLSIRVQTTETCMWFAFYYRPKSASGQGLECGVNQTKKTRRVLPSFQINSRAQQVPGLKHFSIQGIHCQNIYRLQEVCVLHDGSHQLSASVLRLITAASQSERRTAVCDMQQP